MNTINKFLLQFCIFILISFIGISHSAYLENIPFDYQIYEYIDMLRLRGLMPHLFAGNKPYTRGEIADELIYIREKINNKEITLSNIELKWIEILEDEFKSEINEIQGSKIINAESESEQSSVVNLNYEIFSNALASRRDNADRITRREILIGRWGIGSGKHFTFQQSVRYDENLGSDTTYNWHIWRGKSGFIEQAYLSTSWKWFKVNAGRDKLRWGVGRKGTLILSDNPHYLDFAQLQFNYRFKSASIRMSAFVGMLDEMFGLNGIVMENITPELSDKITRGYEFDIANRYLSGHILNCLFAPKLFNMNPRLELGIAETMLYGGIGRQLEPYYMNPLILYHSAQFEQPMNDNTLWCGNANLSVPVKSALSLEIYGEYLIDDYQIDTDQDEANQDAYLFGTEFIFPVYLGTIKFLSEYTKINNWVYNNYNILNRYLTRGKIIGHFLGPDADDLYFNLTYYPHHRLKISSNYGITRNGEGHIKSKWSASRNNAFLSGIVEKTKYQGFSIEYQPHFLYTNWFFVFDFNNFDITNVNNLEMQNEKGWEAKIKTKFIFRSR